MPRKRFYVSSLQIPQSKRVSFVTCEQNQITRHYSKLRGKWEKSIGRRQASQTAVINCSYFPKGLGTKLEHYSKHVHHNGKSEVTDLDRFDWRRSERLVLSYHFITWRNGDGSFKHEEGFVAGIAAKQTLV